jgi:hypothetical protein
MHEEKIGGLKFEATHAKTLTRPYLKNKLGETVHVQLSRRWSVARPSLTPGKNSELYLKNKLKQKRMGTWLKL